MPYILPKPNVSEPLSSSILTGSSTCPIFLEPEPLDLEKAGGNQGLKPALKKRLSHDTLTSLSISTSEDVLRGARQPRPRSKSAPSFLAIISELSSAATPPTPPPTSPPKSVRFPDDADLLERVRTFRKHGKPISISRPPVEETETETEGESSSASGFRYEGTIHGFGTPSFLDRTRYTLTHFPRPSLGLLRSSVRLPALPVARKTGPGPRSLEIDESASSPVPNPGSDPSAKVHLESLRCSSDSVTPAEVCLAGTILVRNIAYTKNVTVRFTLDDWTTISNVSAQYVEGLPSLPTSFLYPQRDPTTPGDLAGLISLAEKQEGWDRFRFTLKLDHAVDTLPDRTLWFAVCYSLEGAEWWDNNDGQNYKVGFRCGGAKSATLSGGEGDPSKFGIPASPGRNPCVSTH